MILLILIKVFFKYIKVFKRKKKLDLSELAKKKKLIKKVSSRIFPKNEYRESLFLFAVVILQ